MPRRHEMLETDECFTACGFMVTWSVSHISFIFQQILFKSIKKINYIIISIVIEVQPYRVTWDAIVFRAVCTGQEELRVLSVPQETKEKITLLGSSWWIGEKVLLVAHSLCGQCRTSPRHLCAGEIWRNSTEELYPDTALKAKMRCVQCWVLTKIGTVPWGGKSMWITHLPVTGDWEVRIWQSSKPPSCQKSPEIRRCSFQKML